MIALHLPKSYTKAIMWVLQIFTHAAVEKEVEHKRNKDKLRYKHDASAGTTAVGISWDEAM